MTAILLTEPIPDFRLDPIAFESNHSLITEAQRAVAAVVNENKQLREVQRSGRRELKKVAELLKVDAPWNVDEVYGILGDLPEITDEIPLPRERARMAYFGNDHKVPLYLRSMDGSSVSIHPMPPGQRLNRHILSLWQTRLDELVAKSGTDKEPSTWPEVIDTYCRGVEQGSRKMQVDFAYNFMLGVRSVTRHGSSGELHHQAELLYRSLSSDMSELVFFDALVMVDQLRANLEALHGTLAIVDDLPAGAPAEGLVFGTSVFSAILRTTFPCKSRANLNALKRALLDSPSEGDTWKSAYIREEGTTGCVVVDVLGLDVCCSPLTGELHPFTSLLLVQHFAECVQYRAKIIAALEESQPHIKRSTLVSPLVSPTVCEQVLMAADHTLSERDRKHIVLRGFGRSLASAANEAPLEEIDRAWSMIAKDRATGSCRDVTKDMFATGLVRPSSLFVPLNSAHADKIMRVSGIAAHSRNTPIFQELSDSGDEEPTVLGSDAPTQLIQNPVVRICDIREAAAQGCVCIPGDEHRPKSFMPLRQRKLSSTGEARRSRGVSLSSSPQR